MAIFRSRKRRLVSPPDHPGETPTIERTELEIAGQDADTEAEGDRSPVFRRGACLGRYVILGSLGSGGMGKVYAAYDPELDRKVAVKVLRGDLLCSEKRKESQTRLLREAQAAARLAHPNVVTVYDVGIVGERLFVAMELIEGATLTAWLETGRRSWRAVLEVLLEAGRGLAAAHDVGLVHRDFKPGNVMISADGRARILDFGLVRAIDPKGGADDGAERESPDAAPALPPESGGEPVWQPSLTVPLTRTGKALGTPAYMAPEQRAGATADARADQFSYCVTLYEALYGELPFDAGAIGVPGGPVREAPPDSPVPTWLRRVLLRGLEADPAARYPSMDALLEVLARDSSARRRRWQKLALVLLAPLSLTLGLWVFEQRRESLCQGAEQRLDGIWDPSRKAAIRGAFRASGLIYAGDAWQGVERVLDGYTRGWVAMRTEACEATHLRGEQSGELLDRRMACLDTRLEELRVLTGLLAHAGPQVIERAVSATDQLGSLAACADRRALSSLLPPPADEETARRIETVRAEIAEAKAQENLGQYVEFLATAQEAFAMAQETPFRPLHGEARLTLARGLGRSGQAVEMRDSLLEAVGIAHATRHHELLAEALTSLIIAEHLLGNAAAARMWGALAASAIEALEQRDDLEARRLRYLGVAVSLDNEHEESIAYFRRSLDHLPEPSSTLRSMILNNLGVSSIALKRFDEAEAHLLQALENSERVFGPHHLYAAIPLTSLGDLYREKGEHQRALARYRHSLDLKEKALGPDHPDLTKTLLGIGWCSIESGQPQAAITALERAVRLCETHPGDPELLALGRFFLARALWDSGGDRRRARSLAEQSQRDLRRLGDRVKEPLRQLDAWLEERGWQP